MYTKPFVPNKNVNLVQNEHNMLFDHDYLVYYVSLLEKSVTLEKKESSILEIMLDLQTKEIISIKILD